MKRSGNRLLAMLLCVAMMLTLLPLTAFARWDEEMPEIPTEVESEAVIKAELPADAPENDSDSAELTAVDGWELRANGVGEVTAIDGGVKLKGATAANFDAAGTAAMTNTAIDAAIAASSDTTKFLEMTLKPTIAKADGSTADNGYLNFGIIINYDGTDGTKGYHIGHEHNANDSFWFVQYYGGNNSFGSQWPSLDRSPEVTPGTPLNVRVEWTDETVVLKVNNTAYALPNNGAMGGVPVTNKIAIKAGSYSSEVTTVEITDLDYSGKPVYNVTGKVTSDGKAVAGVTVTTGKKTTTTDANGDYTFTRMANGTYTLTYTKEGYTTTTQEVTVNNADTTVNTVTLAEADIVQIPTDGVNNGDWRQVAGTVGTSVAPAVTDGKLVLESGDTNGHKLQGVTVKPAIFTSDKMNSALAGVDGKKTLLFTLTPETTFSGQGDIPNYLAFGVVLDSNEDNQGYMISYSNNEGWLMQNYGGSGYKVLGGLAAPTVGQPMKFEITWDRTDASSESSVTLSINGTDVAPGVTLNTLAKTDKVAFFAGGSYYETENQSLQSQRHTKLTISDLHYSGQETVDARFVSGTVKCGTKAVEGATVSAASGKYTAETDANGAYRLKLPLSDTAYTIQAEKDGYTTENKSVTVTANAAADTLKNVNFTLTELPKITGKVVDKNGNPVRATVSSDKRAADKKPAVVCGTDGIFTIIGAVAGDHVLTISAEGYETAEKTVTVAATDVDAGIIQLADRVIPFYTLSTEDMDVRVAQNFPQVIDYKMKKLLDANGQPKVMYGQTAELDTILLNGAIETMTDAGVAVKPAVTSTFDPADPTKVTYTMVIDETNNNGSGVTATITAELRVGLDDVNDQTSASAGRTLGFYITGVTYPNNDRLAHPVDNIAIPNHSLVSVRSTQEGAKVKGAKLAANTTVTGDVEYPAAGNEASAQGDNPYKEDFFAAFVSNNELSAGLSSNSAYAARGSAGDQNYPVRAQFEAKDGGETVSIGLGSTLWYYDHDITRDEAGGDLTLTLEQLPKEKRIIAPLETPYAKVVIAGDENENGKVDWQDGAIAYRETVMHIPVGGESVADAVNLRISMNFGSMAANPFLIALDNVKRVAAHTDGLGQFVLLKGYAGEGHDSNHPQYDNIGIRMGGPEDLKALISEGGKLGATFGIHTNASEFYAEAISDESQVRRNTNGSIHYGWNWLDQGIAINGVYDYATGQQKTRWDSLYDIVDYNLVKDHPFVVYVDVWGNNTSGTENDFMTRALSQNIIGHNGWRIAHEWSWANPYESTFQHWVTDYTYGNYSDKGKLNSNVMRFLLNQYKDSFPPDFATFGGAANAPLLGGPAMQGFEGWQGDGEYNLSIYNTFNEMIYTKFLQHYPVMEWTNADTAVKMPYSQGANGARSNEADWVPEVQLKLAGDGDEIVVTRGTTGKLVTDFKMDTTAKFLANETEYRSRVVTLNGKKIVEGAPASAGEDNAFPKSKSTLKYLIPWYWDNEGTRLTDVQDQKLYHWNAQGGISTWDVPKGWENLGSVMVYALSDQGRSQGKSVKIIDGKLTLTAEAETCYVVVPGENKGNPPQITYGEGLHLQDPSFNMDTAREDCPWKIEGTGSAVHTTNSEGIGVLKMVGAVSVSQKFTDLVAGKNYVTYAAIDNRADKAKVTMTITDGEGNVVATNYAEKSIARNYVSSYYLHNGHGMEAGGSYFQNMFLYFTPEAGKEYTLTISREAGRGNAYVDDVRTVEYGFNYSGFGAGQTAQTDKGTATIPVTYDPATGAATALHQDFENVPQGIWPFVVGPAENVADNRVHVSELNTPFTQAGWDVKKLDDVIDGNWSIKVNGLSGRQNLIYQTIPQNFRFEPGKAYTVEFDYELGSEGSYVAVVGDGAYTGLDGLTVINLEKTLQLDVPNSSGVAGNTTAKATVGHAKFTVMGSDSGQTWIGIYSKEPADNMGTSGSAAAFGGYLDFVLDNLSIELAPAEKNDLALALREADAMTNSEIYESNDTNITDEAAWTAFTTARTEGHTVFDNDDATQQQVTAALNALTAAMGKLDKVMVVISGTVKNANNAPVEGVELTLESSDYVPVGLTVTTGADGTFHFESKSGTELVPATYRIKAQATGYNVTTTDSIEATKAAPNVTKDIALEAEAPGAYVNDFNTGDISMMGYLVPEDTADLPTIEATEYNGSGALKITWNAGSGETRHLNNVVDKTVTMANGTFSFDVVPLTNDGLRLGITFRGQEGTAENVDRVFVGQEDTIKYWFVEHWNSEGSPTTGYTSVTEKAIGLNVNVTRNVRAVMNNMSFQVFVDGVKIYDVDASTALPSMITEAGYVGFNMRLRPGTEYIIDNIRIIRADAAEGVHNISGEVHGQSGAAVSGAAVELFDGDTRVAGTTTNALGAYQISRVTPGRYTMKVSAPFFQGKEQTVTVASADLTGQNFVLTPDRTDLNKLIAEVEALTEADYTPETWASLKEALDAAKAIDDTSSKAALESAYKALSNAKAALEQTEATPVDFSALRTTYNELATKLNDNYTNATWTAFQEALATAKATLLNGDATQEQVDKAKTDLEAANTALVQAADPNTLDFTALQTAYDNAKDVEKGSYTDDTWEKFAAARDVALAILSNADGLTQDDVDAAAKELTAAQSGLRSTGGGGGGGTSTPSETTKTETREDGSKVTIVTKPDGSKTVTVEQPDGTKSETVTTKNGDVTITVTDENGEELVKAEIPATIPEPETKFEDVDVTPWAEEAIHKMAGLELVNGTGGNKYSPVAPMTRGSLATVLHRLSQGKTDYETTFKDVAEGKYYTEGVAWAAKAKVVTGYSEDIFAPDDVITREQLAVMLARYAKLVGMDTKADAKALEAFADGENTGSWAVDGVAWCVANGILKGKGQNNLDPTAKVTRAEVAVMLDRFIALIQK